MSRLLGHAVFCWNSIIFPHSFFLLDYYLHYVLSLHIKWWTFPFLENVQMSVLRIRFTLMGIWILTLACVDLDPELDIFGSATWPCHVDLDSDLDICGTGSYLDLDPDLDMWWSGSWPWHLVIWILTLTSGSGSLPWHVDPDPDLNMCGSESWPWHV